MPIKNSQNLINPIIRNAGSFFEQKNLSVKWGFLVGRVFMKKKKIIGFVLRTSIGL